MAIRYYLGPSSATAVELFPEWGYKNRKRQIRSLQRTSGGGLYVYKWGDYRRISFDIDYVPASVASQINSWWDTNTELMFFVESDGTTEVFSVMLTSDDTPIANFSKPYVDHYKGTIELEGY